MLNNQHFTANRAKYLGGSDIGAILGFSKYLTALDVWLEKTGRKIHSVDNLPVRFGTFAEEFVASEYAAQTGYALVHNEAGVAHPQYPDMVGHIDRYVLESSDAIDGVNRYQYPRHYPVSLGTAFHILPEKAHCCNHDA